jgi:hypothetical protein
MMSVSTPIWRVMAWNPVQMAWTVRSTHTDPVLAAEHADALRHKDRRLRVLVVKAGVKRVLQIKPPVHNETQRWRYQHAARMSDLADANKRYKSPG